MNNISFCIPSKNNLRYLKRAIEYLRKNCDQKDHEILIWVDKDDDGTSEYLSSLQDEHIRFWVNPSKEPLGIGNAYDYLVSNAKNDLVMMYHADMIAGEGIDTAVLEHHAQNVVVCATRIEPPLHPTELCKITEDFGLWPESVDEVADGFQEKKFSYAVASLKNKFKGKTTPGVFAPWLISKQDYFALGGHDPLLNSLAEDNDIFNRMFLAGFKFVQTWEGLVYHLTCRGGQFETAKTTEDLRNKSQAWLQLSQIKTREFIRKWKYAPMSSELKEPIVWNSYDVHANLTGVVDGPRTISYLQTIEPYFSSITVDNPEVARRYIEQESRNTQYNLHDKFFGNKENSIVVTFNLSALNAPLFSAVIEKLPLIIDQITENGTYKYDIFTFNINRL